jgi:hypothetical protein
MSVAELAPAGNAAWPEPGQRYCDPGGHTVVLVLTAPRWPGVLHCNGRVMVPARPVPCSYDPGTGTGGALRPGWRYREPSSGLEVRCLCGGDGCLAYGVPGAGRRPWNRPGSG